MYTLLGHVMLCYAMLLYVMRCHAICYAAHYMLCSLYAMLLTICYAHYMLCCSLYAMLLTICYAHYMLCAMLCGSTAATLCYKHARLCYAMGYARQYIVMLYWHMYNMLHFCLYHYSPHDTGLCFTISNIDMPCFRLCYRSH